MSSARVGVYITSKPKKKFASSDAAIAGSFCSLKMSTNTGAIPETSSSHENSLFVALKPPRRIRLPLQEHEEPPPLEEMNFCSDSDKLVTGIKLFDSYGKPAVLLHVCY